MNEFIEDAYEVRYSEVLSRTKHPVKIQSKHIFNLRACDTLRISKNQFVSALVKLSEKIKRIQEILFAFYNPCFQSALRLVETKTVRPPVYDDNVLLIFQSNRQLCTVITCTFVTHYDKHGLPCSRDLPTFDLNAHGKLYIDQVVISQSDAEVSIETTFRLVCSFAR